MIPRFAITECIKGHPLRRRAQRIKRVKEEQEARYDVLDCCECASEVSSKVFDKLQALRRFFSSTHQADLVFSRGRLKAGLADRYRCNLKSRNP